MRHIGKLGWGAGIAGRSLFHLARTVGFVALVLLVVAFAAATAVAGRITVEVTDLGRPTYNGEVPGPLLVSFASSTSFARPVAFTRTNKPRAVSVKYGGKAFVLSRVGHTANTSSWQTRTSDFSGLDGKRVTVVEKTQRGTKTFIRTVLCWNGFPPPPGGFGCGV